MFSYIVLTPFRGTLACHHGNWPSPVLNYSYTEGLRQKEAQGKETGMVSNVKTTTTTSAVATTINRRAVMDKSFSKSELIGLRAVARSDFETLPLFHCCCDDFRGDCCVNVCG